MDAIDGNTRDSEVENIPHIQLTVLHNRNKYPFSLPHSTTLAELKQKLETLTQIPVKMQKLIHRDLLSDETSLGSMKFNTKTPKIMLVGVTKSDIAEVDKVDRPFIIEGQSTESKSSKDPDNWCDRADHKHVLEVFGRPDDALVGLLNSTETLEPDQNLPGLLDKRGRALRLRIRPDTRELWLATKDLTHKLPLATIHSVDSQPIRGHPEYHIMAFQLGPTPKSRHFVYWIPAQYVESIKLSISRYKEGHPK